MLPFTRLVKKGVNFLGFLHFQKFLWRKRQIFKFFFGKKWTKAFHQRRKQKASHFFPVCCWAMVLVVLLLLVLVLADGDEPSCTTPSQSCDDSSSNSSDVEKVKGSFLGRFIFQKRSLSTMVSQTIFCRIIQRFLMQCHIFVTSWVGLLLILWSKLLVRSTVKKN